MGIFIKVTPVNTGQQHVIAVRTITQVEINRDPALPEAQSLITFNTGARWLVYETIDEIVAAAR